jgi:hypothetical protein
MSVTVLCTNLSCKAILHVPDNMRGQMIRCGQCGTYLTVPQGHGGGGASPSTSGTDQANMTDSSKKEKTKKTWA